MPRKRTRQPEDYFAAFPRRLREQMKLQGITQQALADYLGIARQSVAAYMDGTSSPYWETVARISDFLGVSSDYLLGRSSVPSIDAELRAACDYSGLNQAAMEALRAYQTGTHRSPVYDTFLEDVVDPTDPAEAKELGAAYLRILGALLAHPLAADLLEEIHCAQQLQASPSERDALDSVLNDLGVETYQELSQRLGRTWVPSADLAKMHLYNAANLWQRIATDLTEKEEKNGIHQKERR